MYRYFSFRYSNKNIIFWRNLVLNMCVKAFVNIVKFFIAICYIQYDKFSPVTQRKVTVLRDCLLYSIYSSKKLRLSLWFKFFEDFRIQTAWSQIRDLCSARSVESFDLARMRDKSTRNRITGQNCLGRVIRKCIIYLPGLSL